MPGFTPYQQTTGPRSTAVDSTGAPIPTWTQHTGNPYDASVGRAPGDPRYLAMQNDWNQQQAAHRQAMLDMLAGRDQQLLQMRDQWRMAQKQATQRPETPAPAPAPIPGPSPMPAPTPGAGPPINANFPPLNIPTRESQNQLMALGAQQANSSLHNILNRGSASGIQAGSGVNLQKAAGPMQQAYQQAALGAAKLGIDDQLLRDTHMMKGILGMGQADIGQARTGINRERIGLDARNQTIGSVADLIRSLGGMLGGSSNLSGLLGGGLFG